MKIEPSARIDYCCECKKDHGYDCPKDKPMTSQNWEKQLATLCHEWFIEDEYQILNSFIKSLLSNDRQSLREKIEGMMRPRDFKTETLAENNYRNGYNLALHKVLPLLND